MMTAPMVQKHVPDAVKGSCQPVIAIFGGAPCSREWVEEIGGYVAQPPVRRLPRLTVFSPNTSRKALHESGSVSQSRDNMNRKTMMLTALAAFIIIASVLMYAEMTGNLSLGDAFQTPMGDGHDLRDVIYEELQFGKNLDIWFMLMLVAFLMIFIKKFEWGVALAVLLSAAASFVVYLGIQDMCTETVWNQALLIRAVICAITLVIAIGVFLGTCKMWQYLLIGAIFAFIYAGVEYLLANLSIFGATATDPGGSILVHMCAAYFGLGVALGIREKRAFDEPNYTTTHSVTFVWLASMLLWMLWPSFVTSLVRMEDITWGTITCYMAGIGSILSTYVVCMGVQGKINPLIFTYAMLCGPVAIGAPLLSVGPWGALLIGVIAGAVSSLCFINLQNWFCSKIGVLDVMGVHNLHGVGGWMGAIFVTVLVGSAASLIMAALVCVITIVAGAIVGLVVRATRGWMDVICDDEPDFIRNEMPAGAVAEESVAEGRACTQGRCRYPGGKKPVVRA